MSEPSPKIEPGQIIGWDHTPGYRQTPIPVRAIDPKLSAILVDVVRSGDLSFEEAMRLVFPEEAARIYDLDHNRLP